MEKENRMRQAKELLKKAKLLNRKLSSVSGKIDRIRDELNTIKDPIENYIIDEDEERDYIDHSDYYYMFPEENELFDLFINQPKAINKNINDKCMDLYALKYGMFGQRFNMMKRGYFFDPDDEDVYCYDYATQKYIKKRIYIMNNVVYVKLYNAFYEPCIIELSLIRDVYYMFHDVLRKIQKRRDKEGKQYRAMMDKAIKEYEEMDQSLEPELYTEYMVGDLVFVDEWAKEPGRWWMKWDIAENKYRARMDKAIKEYEEMDPSPVPDLYPDLLKDNYMPYMGEDEYD